MLHLYYEIGLAVSAAVATGATLRMEMDSGTFDLAGDDLATEWDDLAPGEAFSVVGVVAPVPDAFLAHAAAMVAADRRDTEEWWTDADTDADIVAHVRNTLRLPDEPPVAGSYPVEDDGTFLAFAYIVTLGGGILH